MTTGDERPARRGLSSGQERARALRVLTSRRDFLDQLVLKRRENGQPHHREAEESSVLSFVLRTLSELWNET